MGMGFYLFCLGQERGIDCTLILTATIAGVCIWMMHFMSGLALCIAECNMKPAIFTPKLVVPASTTFPCISTFTREEAVISL